MSEDPNYHKYAGWAEAFTIFAKYADHEEDVNHVAVEHDEIFAGPDIKQVPVEDRKRLEALGWTYDKSVDCWHRFT